MPNSLPDTSLHKKSNALPPASDSVPQYAPGNSFFNPAHFRRISGIAVGLVMLVLLFLAVLLNLHEGNAAMIPALVTAAIPAIIAIILLFKDDLKMQFLPQVLLCGTMAILGLYLLLVRSASGGASLYWFIIYPPMVMFSLGLRLGTAIVAAFFFMLCLLLLTPLDVFLANRLTSAEHLRFLLALLGSFAFSWCSEYLHHSTQLALNCSLEHLEKEATTDPLTGLGNRRDFEHFFEWVLARARRGNANYALAMLDLDHFKRVNDIYGHDVGDGMLCHVARTLSSGLRATDRVFRWGGEEFVILMPDTESTTARLAAERMRKYAEDHPYSDGGTVIPYTVSIGLYCGKGNEDGFGEKALIEADRNLYAAKNSGRNTVVG